MKNCHIAPINTQQLHSFVKNFPLSLIYHIRPNWIKNTVCRTIDDFDVLSWIFGIVSNGVWTMAKLLEIIWKWIIERYRKIYWKFKNKSRFFGHMEKLFLFLPNIWVKSSFPGKVKELPPSFDWMAHDMYGLKFVWYTFKFEGRSEYFIFEKT